MRILRIFALAVFLNLILLAGSFAANPSDIPTHVIVLDNGLTVIVSEMASSSTVSVYGLVKTGSALEGKYLGSGISHFLEHMLFKGTDKRKVGQISKEIQAMGGEINASTSFDYTIYTLTVPNSHFDEALDILSDMLTHSKFDSQEIEKEREVVFGEMRLYNDNPDRILSDELLKIAYLQHPYRIPPIGYESLLRTLKREDFLDYYQSRYTPSNIIISICGNVNSGEILPKIEKAFKDFKQKPVTLRNIVSEPPQISSRFKSIEYHTDLARIALGYSGVGLLDPDLYAMDVLAIILGQGESSRLFSNLLIRQREVRAISASNFTPLDRGIFEIDALAEEKNIDDVIKAVKNEIENVKRDGVREDELNKAKRQVAASHVLGRITSDAVAYDIALNQAFSGDYDFSKKYLDAVEKLSTDDIKRVARQYLTESKLSIIVVKPKSDKSQAISETVSKKTLEFEKFSLPNGLRVLLRENHEFPIVNIALVLNGGSTQETEQTSGLFSLMANVWDKGTRAHGPESIRETLESRAIALEPFSGRQSFGLTMTMLAKEFDTGLGLLEEVIKSPTFPQDQINLEKDMAKTSISTQDDNIHVIASRKMRQTLFESDPWRLDTIGTMESVGKISRDQILDCFKQWVTPANMVLEISGDFDSNQVRDYLKKHFNDLSGSPVKMQLTHENVPQSTRSVNAVLKKEQAMVLVGFQGVDIKSPDRYKMEVMSAILGSPFSGRIFNTIRDEFASAYTLGGNFTPGISTGLISFYVQTTDDQADRVKDRLLGLIKELGDKDVSLQELNNIKTYLKGSWAMQIQTDASLGLTAAFDELYGNGYDFYKAYDSRIDAVTVQDIRRLAKDYLDINKAAVIVIRPERIFLQQMGNKKTQMPHPTVDGPRDIH